MKQCPQCGSIYSDDTLNYCLTDGNSLLPAGQSEELPTLVRESPGAPITRISGPIGVSPVFKYLAIGLASLFVLSGIVGLAIFALWRSSQDPVRSSDTPARTPVATPERPVIPTPSPTAARASTPKDDPRSDLPRTDPGPSRITFKRGSISEVVRGSVAEQRSFVLRTMKGQTLSATVTSPDRCVSFEGGAASVQFSTPAGDAGLTIRNACGEPSPFSLTVTVR